MLQSYFLHAKLVNISIRQHIFVNTFFNTNGNAMAIQQTLFINTSFNTLNKLYIYLIYNTQHII